MIYWIERMEDGTAVKGASSYEEALRVESDCINNGMDVYIRKDDKN